MRAAVASRVGAGRHLVYTWFPWSPRDANLHFKMSNVP